MRVNRLKAPPIGKGERFSSLVKQLSSKKGISPPSPLASHVTRKKYGKKRFVK